MFLPNLTTDAMYEVKIRGATRSLLVPSKIFPGQFSESRKIYVAADCDRVSWSPATGSAGDDAAGRHEMELSAGTCPLPSHEPLRHYLIFTTWNSYSVCSIYNG